MKKTIRIQNLTFLLFSACAIALAGACEKDVSAEKEEHFTSLTDFIAETEVKDTGLTVLLFTAGDSASLRKDKSPHLIQGFLPLYQVPENTTCALFTVPYQSFPDTLSDKLFRFFDMAQIQNGIFTLSPDFTPGDFWVKAVVNTGDSLHISNAARLTLTGNQTDFIGEDKIELGKDNLNRTSINLREYPAEQCVLNISNRNKHLLSLFTRRREFVLFSSADFEYNSDSEISNPDFSAGSYTLDLFLLNHEYRATGRFITEYMVEE